MSEIDIEPIEIDFATAYPEPRADGKYRFAIELDLSNDTPSRLLAILTSPEAQALSDADFEFEYDARNGIGQLAGWRDATEDELARLEAKRKQSAKWQAERDRRELERIKKEHPGWA